MNKKLALLNPVSPFKLITHLIRNLSPKKDKQISRSSNTMKTLETSMIKKSTMLIKLKLKTRSQISKLTKFKTTSKVKATKSEGVTIDKAAWNDFFIICNFKPLKKDD
jgi:hypothetical protein